MLFVTMSCPMTIAYNSAHVKTETLNFSFAQQVGIVYFDAEC